MAGITSYAGLQDAIADWLIRSDLDDVIPTFIANAESTLRRDRRVRLLTTTTLSAESAVEALPEDYRGLEGLWYDGPTHFGRVRTVDPATLGDAESALGETGVPTHGAVISTNPPQIRFAPVPDDEYTLRLSYWATILPLNDTRLSNWLLEEHPDVYLYASLVESAPYLRDDQRVTLWTGLLEKRLDELDADTTDRQYSGHMTSFPQRNIP